MLKFEIQGEKDLLKAFQQLRGTQADEQVFAKAVDSTTLVILEESQKNIKKNGSSTTGQLMNSGRVERVKVGNAGVEGGVSYLSSHAWYVEFGRRAGKMPPVAAIAQWVKKRGIKIPAFVIARSIGRKGTKAQPFLYPALQGKQQTLINYVKVYYEQFTKR